MNTNETKLVKLIGNRTVTLSSILDNLKVLKVENDTIKVSYVITREDKTIPWPAPYEAGQHINGSKYHCCSYVTMDDDDTKKLNVYIAQ